MLTNFHFFKKIRYSFFVRRILLVLFLLLLINYSSYASLDSNGYLVLGKIPELTFYIQVPTNWIGDIESGAPQNLNIVAYPENSNFSNSTKIIYARFQPKKIIDQKNMKSLIDYDVQNWKSAHPEGSYRIVTQDQYKNLIKTLSKTTKVLGVSTIEFINENSELFGFEKLVIIETPMAFHYICILCSTKEEFDNLQTDFQDVVNSFRFVPVGAK